MPASEPPIRFMGERSALASAIWQAPSWRPTVMALELVGLAYRGFMRARRAAYRNSVFAGARIGVPVISVGNLIVGGSGKTPVTRWLVERLRELGRRPAILHGGYAADEPALHRRWFADAIVVAQRDRVAGAQAAIAAGADTVVLDDALQHLRIARDLDIVLIPADSWDSPHRLLPAGSWREPLSAIPENALVLVTRKAASPAAARAIALSLRKRTQAAAVATCALPLQVATAGPAIAVCAIADPRAFANQLMQAGVEVDEVLAFDDHHEYSADDWASIQQTAHGRAVIVTEKDAVKLEKITQAPLLIATQSVALESGAAEVDGLIRAALQ